MKNVELILNLTGKNIEVNNVFEPLSEDKKKIQTLLETNNIPSHDCIEFFCRIVRDYEVKAVMIREISHLTPDLTDILVKEGILVLTH